MPAYKVGAQVDMAVDVPQEHIHITQQYVCTYIKAHTSELIVRRSEMYVNKVCIDVIACPRVSSSLALLFVLAAAVSRSFV